MHSLISRYLLYYPVVFARGQNVPVHIRMLMQTQHDERSRLALLQLTTLNHLLSAATPQVPHLLQYFAGRTPALASLNAIQDLPFITKAELQQEPDRFRSTRMSLLDTTKTTGGSTGVAVTIRKDRRAIAWELAAAWRGYSWAGIRVGDPQARFWGVPFSSPGRARARLIDSVCNRIRLPAFAYTDAAFAGYFDRVCSFKPRWFYGYVSHIQEFASYCASRGLRFEGFPSAVITTAEVLTKSHRETIEAAFGAPVFNEYGCGEVGTIAHECEAHRLHINEENVLVEIVDAGGALLPPGERGEIVVTDLHNKAMPLIRYRIGDIGVLDDAPCPCGRSLRVLRDVYGRQYDVLVNREGKRFHGEFIMYIFEDVMRKRPAVRQFQVEQMAEDKFTVRFVPGLSFGPDTRDEILQRVREHIDPNATIEFQSVDSIPREPSGKMRLIIGLRPSPGQRTP